jgi:hypothetical protein
VAAAVLTAALALGGLPGGAEGAIKVRSKGGSTLARFGGLDCKLKRIGGGKRFTAKAAKGGWRLNVIIFPGDFDGFHRYEVLYGGDSPVDVLAGSGSRVFANYNKPDPGAGPQLTVAGAVGFPNARHRRRVLGVGVPLIYDSPTGGKWVSVVGRARCRY